jgi:two-component system response regulator AtoC
MIESDRDTSTVEPEVLTPAFGAHGNEVVLVDDDRDVLDYLRDVLSNAGVPCRDFDSSKAAWQYLQNSTSSIVITDWQMPEMNGMELLFKLRNLPRPPYVVVLSAFGSVSRAVQAMSNGAYSFVEKPIDATQLLALVQSLQSSAPAHSPRLRSSTMMGLTSLPIARSAAMKSVLDTARLAASTDSSVLLLGESGTGKEVVANYIHQCSRRQHAPLVKVNCGALPENLMESELFGHEKGAFTGAERRRLGRFENAHTGTLFLDEIGDLPLALQVKLLRVLQERLIERVGSNVSLPVDIRLICATHRDLNKAMAEHQFREDLFYRINVLPIRLPALRERAEDIEPLTVHFVRKFSANCGQAPKALSAEAASRLTAFNWPGNVRQLQNAIEFAMVLCQGDTIEVHHLPDEVRDPKPALAPISHSRIPTAAPEAPAADLPAAASDPTLSALDQSIKSAEAREIMAALKRNHWRMTAVAKDLKISRSKLYDRLKEYGIKRPV